MNFLLENLGKIGFDWRMALFSLINFFIVFLILKKMFFKPVTDAINGRQDKMREGIENMKKAKTELQMAEQKAQDMIDLAKVDANKIVEKASGDAQVAGERMKEKAKIEIESLVSQAKKNIEADRAEMKDTLRKETVDLIILTLEKVLSEKMDNKTDKKYIEDILSTLNK